MISLNKVTLSALLWLLACIMTIFGAVDLTVCPDPENFEPTGLIKATLQDELEVVECLLAKGDNINQVNYRNISALMYAADKGKIEIAHYLIDQGADIELYSDNWWTALMNAASECHEDIALRLIKKGATIRNHDKQKFNALHLAAFHGCYFTVEAILKLDTSFINNQNKNGDTALGLAAQEGRTKIAVHLLKKKANFEIKNQKGITPLMIAAASGHEEIVKALLKHGASTSTVSEDGETAMSWAKRNEHDEVVEVLENWSKNQKKKSVNVAGDDAEF